MNQLAVEKMADILEEFVERKSVRGVARTMRGNSKSRRKGLSINTALKLLSDGGDTADRFLSGRLRKLPCRLLEADEVYAIVKMKPATLLARGMVSAELGAVWLWFAIDAESRLIVHWHVGGRTQRDANVFMEGLSAKLAEKVQLTTDSLAAYPRAVAAAFDEIDFATVKKQDEEEERRRVAAELAGIPYRPRYRRKRIGDSPREKQPPVVHLGSPDLRFATTNHIEAFFSELRKDLSRLTRRSKMLSKTLDNLKRNIALYVFHHNFVKRHTSLAGRTPAVAAGIEDSIWTWDDFVELVIEFRQQRSIARKSYKSLLMAPQNTDANDRPTTEVVAHTGSTDSALFCVYHDSKLDTTRLHLLSCRHLRLGPDRAGRTGRGVKHRCETLDQATELAETITPRRVETCKVCLGRYNAKDYFGPR